MPLTDAWLLTSSVCRMAILLDRQQLLRCWVPQWSALELSGSVASNSAGCVRETSLSSYGRGHQGIEVNERADQLARTGTEILSMRPEPASALGKSYFKQELREIIESKPSRYCCNMGGLRQPKTLFGGFNKSRHVVLIGLSTNNLRILNSSPSIADWEDSWKYLDFVSKRRKLCDTSW